MEEEAKTGLSGGGMGGGRRLTSVQIHEDGPQPKSSRVRKLTKEDEDKNEYSRHVAAVRT